MSLRNSRRAAKSKKNYPDRAGSRLLQIRDRHRAAGAEIQNGGELSLERLYLKAPQENELVRVIAPGNEFLGMGEVSDGEIKVKRLLIK